MGTRGSARHLVTAQMKIEAGQASKSENKKAMIIQGRPLKNYAYPKRASASLCFFISLSPPIRPKVGGASHL